MMVTHAKSFAALALMLFAVATNGADEVTNISVIQADTGRETALKRKLPIGLIHVRPGDRLVLSAGSRRKHTLLVSESRKSSLGNTIIRGETISGGRVLLVIDDEARIKGHFQEPNGMVQLTTDEFGVTTAWREGIDTVPVPFKCEVEDRPDGAWPTQEQLQIQKSRTRTPVQASKFAVEAEESEVRFARYATGHATVRILIYYDSTMEEYIERLADFLIEITNDAFSDSKVSMSLELAALLPIEWDASISTADAFSLMRDREAPYENIDSDRQKYGVALIASLVDEERPGGDDDSWGKGALGNQFSVGTYSITRSRSYSPGEEFYSDFLFAHEIGHNLGLNHNREEFTEEQIKDKITFSYAYGFYEPDVHRTIMSYNTFGYVPKIPFYSNPDLTLDGFRLGRSFLDREAADASRVLFNNRHPAATILRTDNPAEQVKERLSVYESDCGEELGENDEKGEARRHSLSLNSNSGIRINSTHKIRPDGSVRVYRYSSDSTYASHYDCRLPDEGLHSLGTEYVESFFRYIDPASGELVESAHVFWEEDMEGDYSHIRVAHTDGGKAVGNTSLILKEGSEHAIEFNADYGFKLTDIESSCNGRRAGNSYIVSVTSDNCRVEAIFGQGDSTTIAQDNFLGLLSVVQGLGQAIPEPSNENKFVGTYHIFRNRMAGREDVIRIGADQSLAFGSNTTRYRWEHNGDNLDAYYMYQPDEPSGDYSFTLSQDSATGRIDVIDAASSSIWMDFYGDRKATDSEHDFDLYELGKAYSSDIWECFNIGRREFPYATLPYYSDFEAKTTSVSLKECQSFCPEILEYRKEKNPDNESIQAETCEGDEDSSGAFVTGFSN